MKKVDSITVVLLFGITLFSIIFLSSFKSEGITLKIISKENKVINTDSLNNNPDEGNIITYTKQDSISDASERWDQFKTQSRNNFLDAMGYQESRNRYHIVNKYGYMGKYQFGSSTLKTLKIKVSRSEFLRDTLLQEEAMLKLLLHNKKRLQKYIDKYEGQVINGVLVTESGLLAAAHLGGQGSVRKWFRNGKVRKDGNGIKITTYMKRFSGYDLYL
jgi:hypothetical protein